MYGKFYFFSKNFIVINQPQNVRKKNYLKKCFIQIKLLSNLDPIENKNRENFIINTRKKNLVESNNFQIKLSVNFGFIEK